MARTGTGLGFVDHRPAGVIYHVGLPHSNQCADRLRGTRQLQEHSALKVRQEMRDGLGGAPLVGADYSTVESVVSISPRTAAKARGRIYLPGYPFAIV